MAYYVVHPGYVTLQNTGETVYVDAGTLATYYGLDVSEYEVNTTQQETSQDGEIIQIHLHPRPDGKYIPIKTSVHDNGTDTFLDKPVGWKKQQQERRAFF